MRLLALLLLMLSHGVHAAALELLWTHPTQYENGAALPPDQIDRTEIEHGACGAGDLPLAPTLVSVPYPAGRWVHDGLADGQQVCYRARTWSKAGEVSAWTGPVKGRTPSKPGKVQGVEIR